MPTWSSRTLQALASASMPGLHQAALRVARATQPPSTPQQLMGQLVAAMQTQSRVLDAPLCWDPECKLSACDGASLATRLVRAAHALAESSDVVADLEGAGNRQALAWTAMCRRAASAALEGQEPGMRVLFSQAFDYADACCADIDAMTRMACSTPAEHGIAPSEAARAGWLTLVTQPQDMDAILYKESLLDARVELAHAQAWQAGLESPPRVDWVAPPHLDRTQRKSDPSQHDGAGADRSSKRQSEPRAVLPLHEQMAASDSIMRALASVKYGSEDTESMQAIQFLATQETLSVSGLLVERPVWVEDCRQTWAQLEELAVDAVTRIEHKIHESSREFSDPFRDPDKQFQGLEAARLGNALKSLRERMNGRDAWLVGPHFEHWLKSCTEKFPDRHDLACQLAYAGGLLGVASCADYIAERLDSRHPQYHPGLLSLKPAWECVVEMTRRPLERELMDYLDTNRVDWDCMSHERIELLLAIRTEYSPEVPSEPFLEDFLLWCNSKWVTLDRPAGTLQDLAESCRISHALRHSGGSDKGAYARGTDPAMLAKPQVPLDEAVHVALTREHSVVVLPMLGDPKSSAAQDLAKRYEVLMKPLPLLVCGMDSERLFDALQAEFPWMEEANDTLANAVALCATGGGPLYCPPIMLWGAPGMGKTRWARRAARLAGVGFEAISLAGSHSAMAITGSERGWRDARPGFAADAMVAAGCANPILLVDEIDKAGTSQHNGSAVSAMLALLERESAASLRDECFLAAIDVSHPLWILTANKLDDLPEPFLTRPTVIECTMPTRAQAAQLVDVMAAGVAETYGMPISMLPQLDVEALAAQYATMGSLRDLRRLVERAVSRSVRTGRSTKTTHKPERLAVGFHGAHKPVAEQARV